MPNTQVDADLSAKMAAFSGDAERVAVLDSTRRFKASWIELGATLSRVLKTSAFRRWGYGSFEEYCRKELHLKHDTALKLTGSYAFLRDEAPDALKRDGVKDALPDYRAIEFWQRAKEQPEAPAEAVEQIRKAILDEGLGAAQLSRRFKETVFPEDADDKKVRARGELLRLSRKLAESLADAPRIPKRLAADVEEQLGRLIEHLESEAT